MDKYINLIEQEHLLDLIKKRQCVLFVGSGISKFEPASLPDASGLKAVILKPFLNFTANKKIVYGLINDDHLRPEVCFQYAYKYLGKKILSVFELFKDTQPNPCHYFIAQLAEKGYCNAVITTNYDDGIENALRIKFRSVVYEHEFLHSSRQVSILKLHGCAKKDLTSCLLNIEDVSFNLSKAKAKMVKEISKDKVLIFLGYRGNDIDIFPMLNSLECSSIVWVLRHFRKPADLTDKLFAQDRRRLLIKKYNGSALQKDLESLVDFLGHNLKFDILNDIKEDIDIHGRIKKAIKNIEKYLDKFIAPMILGEICEHLGMNKKGLNFYREAQSNSNRQNYHLAELHAIRLLSIMGEGEKYEVIKGYREIISSVTSNNRVCIQAHQGLAERLRLEGKDKLLEAEKIVKDGFALAKSNKCYSEMAWLLLTEANILSDKEFTDKEKVDIIKLYKKSLYVFKKERNLKGYAQATSDLASFYYTECDYIKVIRLFQRTGEYFADINEKTGLEIALAHLGMLKAEFGELCLAREYMGGAYLIAKELNDRRRIATCLANLGWICIESGEINEALGLINNSLDITKRISFYGLQHYLMILKATYYLLQMKEGALTKLMKSLKEHLITEKFVLSQYFLLKAKVFIFNKDTAKAEYYINQIFRLLHDFTASYIIGKAHFLEAQIHLDKKEVKKALLELKCALQFIGLYNNFLAYIFTTHFIDSISMLDFKNKKVALGELTDIRNKILRKIYRKKLQRELAIANNILRSNKINSFLFI